MSTASAKFCAGCGHALQPGAKFCPDCGDKVAPAVAAAEAVASAEPAAPKAAAQPAAEAPKKPAPAAAKDDRHDHLPLPGADEEESDADLEEIHPQRLTKGPPVPVIAGAIAALVVLGSLGYLFTDAERLAAFQCRVLGQADKCETEAMKLAKLKRQQFEEEQQLMIAATAQFDLSFDPKESWVTIVQKRYEEPRDEFVKRVKDNGPDARKLQEVRYGDYVVSKAGKSDQGQIKGAIAFVTEDEWKAKHASPDTQPALIPEPPPLPPKPGEPEPPPPPPPPKLPTGPISWWPKKNQEIALPMAVQNLPMLEKEQADATGKRLTADAIAELQKQMEEAQNAPAHAEGEAAKTVEIGKEVKTVAVSTWTYEIHLWAPGYFQRDIVFYDDPLPPELDKKKLEAEGWTVRKFKKTPEGKLVIDNASFDLLPEPRTLQGRYLRVIKEIYCLKQSKEYQGKSPQGQKDDEELLWEQAAFTKEKKEIALKNDGDPEFEKVKAVTLQEAKCEKEP